MGETLLAFDLETWKIMPEGEKDWKSHRPLGISCASLVGNEETSMTFCHLDEYGKPSPDKMDIHDLEFMLDEIDCCIEDGAILVTWNGAAFDFDILLEEMGEPFRERITKLCLNHWDIMFHFLSVMGYPVGLDTVAKTMGLAGKTEGMHGDLAPILWQQCYGDRERVLEYVLQDSITTLQVAQAILDRERISWTSKKGFQKSLMMPNHILVSECLRIPEVDQSWMDSPLKKAEIIKWMDI